MNDGLDFSNVGRDQGDRAYPRFHMQPIQNNFKSREEGRPIYDEYEFVEITIPGDTKCIMDRHVKPEDKQRWPRQYAAFKEGLEAPLEGTPLEEWPAVGTSQVLELKAQRIRTVEDIAGLTDDILSKAVRQGGYALREKARAWLASAKSNAPLEQMRAKIDEQARELALLKAQMAQAAQPKENANVDG